MKDVKKNLAISKDRQDLNNIIMTHFVGNIYGLQSVFFKKR